MRFLKITILGAACLCACTAKSQNVDWKRVERMSEANLSKLYYENAILPDWVKGSHFVKYNKMENGQNVYYIVSLKNRKPERLVENVDNFVRQYRELTGDTTMTTANFTLYSIEMSADDTSKFYWTRKGKRLVYHRKSGEMTMDNRETTSRSNRSRVPSCHSGSSTADSTFTMLGDKYNLYVRDNRTGKTTQLTTDGVENGSYCYKSAKDTLLESNQSGKWKGHIYLNFVNDDSKVGDLYIINALAKRRPKLITKKMPLPNEKHVRQFKLFWYDADKREGHLLPIYKFKDQFVSMNFGDAGDDLYFIRRNRGVDTLELCRVDIPTGKVETVLSEVCRPHVNVNLFDYRLLNKGKEILWWSERTGKGNYYLYDRNGKLIRRVTKGDNLVAGNIIRIDTLRRQVYFTGYGNEKGVDPYYKFQYRASLDGKGQQCLSHGDGTHELQFCDDGMYAIDSYSRIDLPTVYNIVSMKNGERYFEFAQRDDNKLRKAGWMPPKRVKLKAADNKTDLYGLMYTPTNMDPAKKYPIISNVYPGPQDDQLPRSFAIDDNGNQSLAEMGFVVVTVAPRGSSPLRGRDFYCYGYGNLRDYAIADDKHAIETLARQYAFIDTTRVGIYGHSGGGAMAATAMMTYPDFYKVGVAASGNHDNNIYIQWWGETFHGLKKIPTNMELAANLKGKLLLISGDVDDNVPYASTLRLAKALIDKNKRFDMIILPGKDHGVWDNYYQNLIRYYFKENLITPSERDIDIINHK